MFCFFLLLDHTKAHALIVERLLAVELDPQTYNGKLRIATGLAILKGIEMVNTRLHEVNLPFKVFHGTGDRVTNPR